MDVGSSKELKETKDLVWVISDWDQGGVHPAARTSPSMVMEVERKWTSIAFLAFIAILVIAEELSAKKMLI
ncbi:hypothetical protein GYMLUDRAFT_239651 [Collybiopsis luxurians FD-317 M1]|nr:hypothetical protein GYMLUDRAFT_239651 [Collybiopsis luxurians FD-317 M1]